jgi:AraC-like DNA-binding protein
MIDPNLIEQTIRRNFHHWAFGVEKLSNSLKLSPGYLYELTYRYYDLCPQKLLETIRLEEALELLAQGHNLATIAKRIGYGHVRSFTKAFKKRLHMTPSVCRAAILSSEDIINELAKLKTKLWNIEKFR